MKTYFLPAIQTMLLLMYSYTLSAQATNITGPLGSGRFGASVTVLTNGNYVVSDPAYDEGATADVGAVYLYNGITHALISTLKGSSANDQVGGEIIALTNGNYVVSSSTWKNGLVPLAGAVTWCSGTTGINGVVSTANSLTGSSFFDIVGGHGIVPLTNGNYVVVSNWWDNGSITDAGAVTWGNGSTGTVGTVSGSNSLVGSTAYDQVGDGMPPIPIPLGVRALSNGNYVVPSPRWDNGAATDAGAVTWGNGTTGTSGIISSSNSLIGSTSNDQLGFYYPIANGNYVVNTAAWDNGSVINAGAVIWGNGSSGTSGIISSSNALVGTKTGDLGTDPVIGLTNGNYVIASSGWDNGAIINVGAVTLGNGITGTTGVISSSNSLIGSTANDAVGSGISFTGAGGIIALSNGNFVVHSQSWDNGVIPNAGAVTWCNGNTGSTGVVSSTNSLVGTTANDYLGNTTSTALANGNYVVRSQYWDNGAITDAGAATWGNGNSGTFGFINSSNSLVGSKASDQIGSGGITALTNGNYVVASSLWDNGVVTDAGAATWGDGSSGIVGIVSSSNSLTGSKANDQVGLVTGLNNGNYVVCSQNWDNGAIANAGAVTWGNGTSGTIGTVNNSNSLVGNTANDFMGSFGITALTNGNYVVRSPVWDNCSVINAGAVSWGNGTSGTFGIVSSSNSLTGSTANDGIGNDINVLSNGNYTVRSQTWDNMLVADAGAVTWGNGNTGVAGPISSCNSVMGTTASGGGSMVSAFNYTNNYLITGRPKDNIVTRFNPMGVSLASSTTSTSSILNCNGTVLLINNTGCNLIANITPSGNSPVTGNLVTKVTIDATVQTSTNGRPYLQRHYDIEPATNADNATATVTFYFTQQEFDNFNNHPFNGPDLPYDGNDVANNKANIRIFQYHGTSTTGLPGSYTGYTGTGPASLEINPDDNKIIWNATENRWEITIDINGFSGFFLSNQGSTILPINILSFTGHNKGLVNELQWKATCLGSTTFTIERSINGTLFSPIGEIQLMANDCDKGLQFTDALPLTGRNWYRLKIKDASGSITFSKTILLTNNSRAVEIVAIKPSVVNTNAQVFISSSKTVKASLILTDIAGRKLMEKALVIAAGNNKIDMDFSTVNGGTCQIYLVADGRRTNTVRFVKQ